MRKIYQAQVWTTNGTYNTDLESKYELSTFASIITETKPDSVVRIGDLIIRAGDFVSASITEEKEAEA